MAKLTRFKISEKRIIKAFKETGRTAFSDKFISELFEHQRDDWRLPQKMNSEKFKEELIEVLGFSSHEIKFPDGGKRIFSYGDTSIYELALAINDKAYLSHYSAISVLNLTEQIPKNIYITVEQSKKLFDSQQPALNQKSIDLAFRKPQRTSINQTVFNGYTLTLLKGKNTNNLGVNTFNKTFKTTNIERTLIDAVVRPSYSGGISEVLKAYINAGSTQKVSVNKMLMYLKKLNYIYPYHQAIGFYIEKSGVFNESQVNMIRELPRLLNFYLTYDMKEMEYSKDWNIYYPKGF